MVSRTESAGRGGIGVRRDAGGSGGRIIQEWIRRREANGLPSPGDWDGPLVNLVIALLWDRNSEEATRRFVLARSSTLSPDQTAKDLAIGRACVQEFRSSDASDVSDTALRPRDEQVGGTARSRHGRVRTAGLADATPVRADRTDVSVHGLVTGGGMVDSVLRVSRQRLPRQRTGF